MGKGIKRWMNRLDAGFMLCCCLWTKKLLQLLLCHCALCVSETSRFFHFASGVKIRNVNLDSHRMLSITRSTSSIIFVFTALSLPPLEYSSLRFSRITTGKRGKTNHQKLEKKKLYKSVQINITRADRNREASMEHWISAAFLSFGRLAKNNICRCLLLQLISKILLWQGFNFKGSVFQTQVNDIETINAREKRCVRFLHFSAV